MTVVPCNVVGGNSAKCSSVVSPVKIPGLWSQTGIQKHGQKLMLRGVSWAFCIYLGNVVDF